MFRKITLYKVFNFLIVQLSFVLSIILRRPLRLAFPYSISIEPTNFCNLRCPQCPTGLNSLKRAKGNIDLDFYKSFINQTYKYLLNLFLYFQGEPFLAPSFFEMVKYAVSKNIYVATSTNAQLLNSQIAENIVKSGLDKLIISVDAIDESTYQKYRVGGQYSKVLYGMKNLLDAKMKFKSALPFIELQFIVMKHNEKQIDEFKHLARQMKLNYAIKTAQIVEFSTANDFIPQKKKYSRYIQQDNKFRLKKKQKNNCNRLWNSLVLTWDAEVLPCCFDKDAEHSFGNAKQQRVLQIFNNDKFKSFAIKLLHKRGQIDICRNCSE